ncbi:acyl-CoA dehydrogenase [Burkholderia sp. LMG 21824]|uniref:acyl-CoA dehydrogenase n=1 Tax=Burkholderia sp. LMG 21824 TaxID=3158172 RepID=UPI003C301552
MTQYNAPLRDMMFVLNELAGLSKIAELPGFEDAGPETAEAILDEAGKLASQVLAPLNAEGDKVGCIWRDGVVKTPPGHKEAYAQYVAGGWNGLTFPQEYGGQGLPKLVASPVQEMVMAANLGFSLCPLLTGGAIEALLFKGSDAQKARYLQRMVEGNWTGTMNLTEPQAGSDLGLVRSRAEPEGDHYRIYGQKIFITHGEHDMAENIVHLVLARLPDSPEGVKGISLFVVPKFLVNDDGSLGERNDVWCVSIEHKLGIHGSPTAVMAYGEREGAIGYLVGEPHRGLEYMFVMMNEARFAVGLQGIGMAERAYQQALNYAKERVQSKSLDDPRGPSVTIIQHPDVRRMLMMMKALTEATRAVGYVVAATLDEAHASPDDEARARARAFAEFMIPIHKGWATEVSIEVANLAIQVHGGMGFIEETGVAQHMRDARILTIYEGTTGIQANDLIGRKTMRDGGATAKAVAALMKGTVAELVGEDDDIGTIRIQLGEAVGSFERCVEWIVATSRKDIKAVHAGAVPFLKLSGLVCGGWQMARAAAVATHKLNAGEGDPEFMRAKIGTALFYADHLLSQVAGLEHAVVRGAHGVLTLSDSQF